MISFLCWKLCANPRILVETYLQLRHSSNKSRSIEKPPEKAGFPKRHRRSKRHRNRKKVVTYHFDEPVDRATHNTDDTLTKSCPLDETTPEVFEETQHEDKKNKKSGKLKQEKNANASQKPKKTIYCLYNWETNTPSTERKPAQSPNAVTTGGRKKGSFVC